jgi:hypothetical protein
LVAVLGVVALDELVEVGALEGLRLQRVVDVGAVVEHPEPLGPRLLLCGLGVEEEDVGFHALGVEDAGGQAQERVDVALFEELAPDDFA